MSKITRRRLVAGVVALAATAGLVACGSKSSSKANKTIAIISPYYSSQPATKQVVDSFEADLDIPAIGDQPMRAVFIRAPYVEAVGPGVEVLARVDRPDGSTIVGVREGRLMATSFHPELTGDHRIHRLFLEIVQDARGMS